MDRLKPGFRLELVTPDGLRFDLHNPPTRAVFGLTGTGMSGRETSTVKMPYVHGEIPLSQRLLPRTIEFSFRWNGDSTTEKWGHHETLVDYLRENRVNPLATVPHQLILHYTKRDSAGVMRYLSRALDVFFQEGMSFAPPEQGVWDEWSVTEEITFIAYDPFWYDPTPTQVALDAAEILLQIPVKFPLVFGAYSIDAQVVNDGTWEVYPVITASGPLRNFSIINRTTGARLNYARELLFDEHLTIDLREGKKSVLDSCGEDNFSYISGDIANFLLLSNPRAAGGVNNIRVISETFADSSTENASQVLFTFNTRYRGV